MEKFLGKIIMFSFAVYVNLAIEFVVLLTAGGHLIDVFLPKIKRSYDQKLKYQEISEDFIFFMAYSVFYLGLNSERSLSIIKQEFLFSKHEELAIEEIFKYYINKEIPQNYKKDNILSYSDKFKRLDIALSKGLDEKVRLFKVVETLFNAQEKNPSTAQINILKKIANNLNINYNRTYQYNYQENPNYRYDYNGSSEESSKNNSNYSSKEGSNSGAYSSSSSNQNSNGYDYQTGYKSSFEQKEDVSYYQATVSQEVKDAFKVLGFDYEIEKDFDLIKKAYKKQAKKFHPDILKGQNATDKQLKEAELKIAQLNKSIDIVKKYLANN